MNKPITCSVVYNFLGVKTGIYFKHSEDFEHFDYYYGLHRVNEKYSNINVYFFVDSEESFIDSLAKRREKKILATATILMKN